MSCCGLQLIFRTAGSYFFLVCSCFFFSFCGLRNRLDVSIFFGCCWLVFYLVAVLIVIPQVKVLLFLVAVLSRQFGFLLFKNVAFKIIPKLAAFACCCGGI